ncbi:LacI family DNA-binding transcriptional regulator [Aquamicrobium sp. LC103]|uniref:LacI family DNA-binding transcriptional regulator n=1 Tax=Aquamicrobium sp. LC103 TaxID=1120658 RepID=UPI00063ECA01|nr:LacI family DNA-binding transcriptional regulator [Aquamicrobium sp. LC103]TKT69219.1 substrate-binding domain-containing protein [Aquamicrobium sp. LC103]
MSSNRVTSIDVAKLAGVSQAAVSRVFTPGASVSPRIVEKVRLAADRLGYRPNRLARSLNTGRSGIIGLAIGYLENQFYPELLQQLSASLQTNGYHVLVFMTGNPDEDVDKVVAEILDYQVDGLIAASVGMSSQLARRAQAAGVPVVLLNRSQDDSTMSSVTSDNHAGGRKVADFLVAGGHRRIGYIAGWESASTQRDREAGFREGLAAHGVGLWARARGEFEREAAADAARELFSTGNRPDAVFVANDHMAFPVMDVLRHEFGLRIPQDVSVVGYDDAPPANWPSYDLTTVRQDRPSMVAACVKIILAGIENRDSPPQRIAIDGPIVIRGSARIPPR